jgi:hemolysin-activating ACP:hemolysin acyltransferase
MEPNISSSEMLIIWCSTGNLVALRHFLETALPSLPQDQQAKYCNHAGRPCAHVPYPSETSSLATLTAKASQPTVFAYL